MANILWASPGTCETVEYRVKNLLLCSKHGIFQSHPIEPRRPWLQGFDFPDCSDQKLRQFLLYALTLGVKLPELPDLFQLVSKHWVQLHDALLFQVRITITRNVVLKEFDLQADTVGKVIELFEVLLWMMFLRIVNYTNAFGLFSLSFLDGFRCFGSGFLVAGLANISIFVVYILLRK